jgi:hypothetical protein
MTGNITGVHSVQPATSVREKIKSLSKNFDKFVLFRIRGSHRDGYEDFYLLGYKVVESLEIQRTFRRKMSSPSTRSKNKPNKKPA